MTPKQKSEKWSDLWMIKNCGADQSWTAREAYLAGYEQAEYDAWVKYSKIAFKELNRFSKRYDLQDRDKVNTKKLSVKCKTKKPVKQKEKRK